jgi:hypothetical protein
VKTQSKSAAAIEHASASRRSRASLQTGISTLSQFYVLAGTFRGIAGIFELVFQSQNFAKHVFGQNMHNTRLNSISPAEGWRPAALTTNP